MTGIILAGGHGRRMGQPKILLAFKGRPLIHEMTDRLKSFCDEVLIITNAQHLNSEMPAVSPANSLAEANRALNRVKGLDGIRMLADRIEDQGPLGGLATGLAEAAHPWSYVISCDSPFVSPRLARMLLERTENADIVVPEWQGRDQPFQALYHRNVEPVASDRLQAGELKMRELLTESRLRVRSVAEAEWRAAGVSPKAFLNLNTQEDLAASQGMDDSECD